MSTEGCLLGFGVYKKTIPDQILDYESEYKEGSKIIVRLFYVWTRDDLDKLCGLFETTRWDLSNHYIDNEQAQAQSWSHNIDEDFSSFDYRGFEVLAKHGFEFFILTNM